MATSSSAPADAWKQQDGQCICKRDGRVSHIQWQWDHRAPSSWEGYEVRVAWREADVHSKPGDSTVRRLHRPSGMLLISQWGFLQTAVPVYWEDDG